MAERYWVNRRGHRQGIGRTVMIHAESCPSLNGRTGPLTDTKTIRRNWYGFYTSRGAAIDAATEVAKDWELAPFECTNCISEGRVNS